MNTKSPLMTGLVAVVTLCMIIPFDALAGPQAAGQRAGEVSRLIPAVSIARGSTSLAAAAKTAVNWQDVVNTQTNARARVALDDGSVLNIGSDSSVRVAKHDAAAQQTDLEVSFGKMRSQAQKISQPNGKFEVHTPAGVAGVVGTDFFVGYENNLMTVIVFEGVVRVCNLAGVCVEVHGGSMTTVRTGDPVGPIAPIITPPSLQTDAVGKTSIDQGPGLTGQVHHLSRSTAITLGIIAIIPAVVIPIVSSRGSNSSTSTVRCLPQTCG